MYFHLQSWGKWFMLLIKMQRNEENRKMYSRMRRQSWPVHREGGEQKAEREGGSPLHQDFSWSVSDIRRGGRGESGREKGSQKKRGRLLFLFIWNWGDKTDPGLCGSTGDRRWRTRSLMPSLTSSLSTRPPARCWWGTGGWEWCVGSSSWESWLTSLGKQSPFIFAAQRIIRGYCLVCFSFVAPLLFQVTKCKKGKVKMSCFTSEGCQGGTDRL